MVWNEELAASLDQSSGVIVFHRIQLTSPQQLAQTIAEKIGNLVEQNEKTLDNKFGSNNVWSDRADGTKGEKRGEQVQERRGHGERTRGMRGTSLHLIFDLTSRQLNFNYRRHSRPWCAIFPRSGQSNARSDLSERMMNFFSLQCLYIPYSFIPRQVPSLFIAIALFEFVITFGDTSNSPVRIFQFFILENIYARSVTSFANTEKYTTSCINFVTSLRDTAVELCLGTDFRVFP